MKIYVLGLGMVFILLPAGVALAIAPLCDDIVAQEYACVSPNLLSQQILFCMFIFSIFGLFVFIFDTFIYFIIELKFS